MTFMLDILFRFYLIWLHLSIYSLYSNLFKLSHLLIIVV